MILIIGAGAAGLAMAYELGQRGIHNQVVERGEIGHTWGQHYDSLRLHTLKEVSALPGLPMPRDYPRFPSAEQVQHYLQRYAAHFALNVQPHTEVLATHREADGWRVTTSAGEYFATALVLATGIWSTPYCPPFEGESTFGGAILHASQYQNAAPFRGQRVLVVGTGNSGSEMAVELSEGGAKVGLSVRGGSVFVPYPRSAWLMRAAAWFFRHAPPPVGEALLRRIRRDFASVGLPLPNRPLLEAYPVVGFELPEAVAAGQVRRFGDIERFVPGGVRFCDGREASFDTVILATGYRPTVQLARGSLILDERGRPRVDGRWRSVVDPRLICVGFHYPATEGWLQAIGRVAQEAAEGIAALLPAYRAGSSASARQ